jgi:tRNA(fMet)-specific endonuclease VapC
MRRPAQLAHRFFQFTGQLAIASISLAELYAGAFKHSQSERLRSLITDLKQELQVIDFDSACAERFGQVRGKLLQQGLSVPNTDLMIASVALVHNLALVTHNIADFRFVPGLIVEDWLTK